MSPSNKGNYSFCHDCAYKTKENTKYPCSQSHKAIRKSSNVKYERDFKICNLKTTNESLNIELSIYLNKY